MIGLALVVFTAIFAAGLQRLRRQGDRRPVQPLGADRHPRRRLLAGPARGLRAAARRRRASSVVSPMRFDQANVKGGGDSVAGLRRRPGDDHRSCSSPRSSRAAPDTLAGLRDDQVLADDGWAEDNGFKLGDTLQVTTPAGSRSTTSSPARTTTSSACSGNILVTNASMTKDWNQPDDASSSSAARATRTSSSRRRGRRSPTSRSPRRRRSPSSRTSQPTRSTSCSGSSSRLLALSVIVALLGIVNTLALAVHERTRELGLLRAVGMSKRQVRRMVRAESVITALIGAVLGLVLGIVFARHRLAAARRRRLRADVPDRDADRADDPRGDRGRARGDPSGAAGVEGRRAAGGDDGVSRAAPAAQRRRPPPAAGDGRRRGAAGADRRQPRPAGALDAVGARRGPGGDPRVHRAHAQADRRRRRVPDGDRGRRPDRRRGRLPRRRLDASLHEHRLLDRRRARGARAHDARRARAGRPRVRRLAAQPRGDPRRAGERAQPGRRRAGRLHARGDAAPDRPRGRAVPRQRRVLPARERVGGAERPLPSAPSPTRSTRPTDPRVRTRIRWTIRRPCWCSATARVAG